MGVVLRKTAIGTTVLLALLLCRVPYAGTVRGHQGNRRIQDDGGDEGEGEASGPSGPEEVAKREVAIGKMAPKMAEFAQEEFNNPKGASPELRKAAATELMRGGPVPSWKKNLGGAYWKYGMCSSSSYWKSVGFGAPWFVYAGEVNHVKRIKVDGEDVREIDPAFAVLNAGYFSVFQNLEAAKQCSKPMVIHAVKDIVEVRTASEYSLTSQRKGIEGSGGDAPAAGMDYCFRITTKVASERPDVYCCGLHAERSQWVSSIRDQVKAQQVASHGDLQETPTLHTAFSKIFPPAPNTICGLKAGSPCLTALDADVPATNTSAGNESSVDAPGMEAKDALAAMKPIRWARAMPIKAAAGQEWVVTPVSKHDQKAAKDEAKGTKAPKNPVSDAVTLCVKGDDGGGLRCLSLEPKVRVMGQVPLPPKRFYKCDGGDSKCFDVTTHKVGMLPGKHDTDSCQKACDVMNQKANAIGPDGQRSTSPHCQGWTYIRPESVLAEYGTQYARCCLKNATVSSSQCHSNRCCDSHMSSDSKPGMVDVDAGVTPGIPERLVMKGKHDSGAAWRHTQQWEINPVGKGEYANTHAQLKLVYGGLCLARMDRPSKHGMDGLVMAPCVDGTKEDIPSSQIFHFHGFKPPAQDDEGEKENVRKEPEVEQSHISDD